MEKKKKMSKLIEKVNDFLAQKQIAVAGVSRNAQGEAANLIFKKLKEAGYQVYPVNPKTDVVEGERCYPNLSAIPVKIDGVVICTPPFAAEQLVKECVDLDIKRVWMHRSFGTGSVSAAAFKFCEQNNIAVIAGACPMMYCQPIDFGHKCLRWILGAFGKLPD